VFGEILDRRILFAQFFAAASANDSAPGVKGVALGAGDVHGASEEVGHDGAHSQDCHNEHDLEQF
jgi:hypothetical protein